MIFDVDFHGVTSIIQCPVNFLYVLELESSFLHPITVGSLPLNNKNVILIGKRKLLSRALMYIKLTGHCMYNQALESSYLSQIISKVFEISYLLYVLAVIFRNCCFSCV